jgi:ketosteroid isomerase-like protein
LLSGDGLLQNLEGAMRKIFFVSLLLLVPSRLPGQTKPPDADQARIIGLENAWARAVKQKDISALQMMLVPELVYVDYDGTLMNKAEYLSSVQSPTLRPQRIVNESMSVRLYGAAAVATGVYRENGEKDGKPYLLRERFTDTWVRHGESWMCVSSDSTLIGQ